MRLGPIVLSGVLAVAGCSSASSSPGSTPPAPAATEQESTAPLLLLPGPLSPGSYVQRTLTPSVSFVLGTGWHAYFNDADGAYLGSAAGVEFGINRPPSIVDPTTNTSEPSPPDLAAWLAASPAFASATASDVTIDGTAATLVDATASHRETDLLAYPAGNFHTVIKARYHFYVVPMDGPDLLFAFMGPAAKFDAALPMVQAIVDSIRIGGG